MRRSRSAAGPMKLAPTSRCGQKATTDDLQWMQRRQLRDSAPPERFHDIRGGVRALCAEFPDEYFRKIDEARGYPHAFVDALTKAGWLAALIPQEYGGSG